MLQGRRAPLQASCLVREKKLLLQQVCTLLILALWGLEAALCTPALGSHHECMVQ